MADTGVSSLVFLDRFTVSYPQTSSLASGAFEGTWAESGTATVSGTAAVALLDVTASLAGCAWLDGDWLRDDRGGALRFRAEAGHRYLAVSPARPAHAARRRAGSVDAARDTEPGRLPADRAAERSSPPPSRCSSAATTRACRHAPSPFEEIADEFGHGQPSAEAIQSFLAYAFQSWARPSPRYVLLLGDASYDPRNFMGTSRPSPLPALWTKTSYLWTASDPLLAAVNGEDALPDLAIGRLPAATVEEAETARREAAGLGRLRPGPLGSGGARGRQPRPRRRLRGGRARHRRELPRRQRSPRLLLLSELGAAARARDPGRARLGPRAAELRRSRRGRRVGERERLELVGRGEPAGAVAPAAAHDDELPERLLRGAGLRLAHGVAAEGRRAAGRSPASRRAASRSTARRTSTTAR